MMLTYTSDVDPALQEACLSCWNALEDAHQNASRALLDVPVSLLTFGELQRLSNPPSKKLFLHRELVLRVLERAGQPEHAEAASRAAEAFLAFQASLPEGHRLVREYGSRQGGCPTVVRLLPSGEVPPRRPSLLERHLRNVGDKLLRDVAQLQKEAE